MTLPEYLRLVADRIAATTDNDEIARLSRVLRDTLDDKLREWEESHIPQPSEPVGGET